MAWLGVGAQTPAPLRTMGGQVADPLSGRRTVDEIRPHMADLRTSACDVKYTDAPT